ncbi:F-box protein [Melia azedarach]|uniref:F-box protein n=1 Tax=Melia azedarach TaxID=155640 RepID=A0ACC1XS37_MELAZ|nr:F-box protein [Melia azedarach]
MVISNEDFFEDVVYAVLVMLPVKSLIRFRCVCKSWDALIKDPKFISKHLKNDNKIRLIVTYTVVDEEDQFAYPTEAFHLFIDETLKDLTREDLDPHQPICGYFGGPYEGVFSIFGINNRLHLWNLATKEHRPLPKCKTNFPRYTRIFRTNTGFGWDPNTYEYKFILLFTLWDQKRNALYDFSHVSVYTLSTNSWKNFESFKSSHYHMPCSFDCTYLDGFCYWLLQFRSNGHRVLLSFHLGEEVFQEIQGPPLPESTEVAFGLNGNSLSLLILDNKASCLEIWTLKENNWFKQLTAGPFVGIFKPLGFWKNDAFFVESHSNQILLYDPHMDEMRDLGIKSSYFSVYHYTESLIPIKGDESFLDSFHIPWHVLSMDE